MSITQASTFRFCDVLRKFEKVGNAVAFLQSYRTMATSVLSVTQIMDENPSIKIREILKEIEHRTLKEVSGVSP
jgi:hypothetical protein